MKNTERTKKLPRPPDMTRQALDDTLKKAITKIANGEPLRIDRNLPGLPRDTFDKDRLNEGYDTEGEVVVFILHAILDGRSPIAIVRENLPEDPVLILHRVEKATKKYGSQTKAYQKIAAGDYKENPRPKIRSRASTEGAIKQEHKRARAAVKKMEARLKNEREALERLRKE